MRSRFGELAQLGERLLCTQEVTGSIPVFSTNCERKAGPFLENGSALYSQRSLESRGGLSAVARRAKVDEAL